MTRWSKIALIGLLIVVFPTIVCGQIAIKHYARPRIQPDSADTEYYGKNHFWRATGEVVGFNIGLWAFDRYVVNGDYARISFNTIKENFKHGFKWDNDKLNTNMFMHPYNGNLYYTAGRSNGFNFWQSSLFAFGGSAMWELFMENEYPSTNDIIATPIGGTAIGEVSYRASDAIIDDRTSGSERIGREVSVFLISPIRGLTRILTGDAWKVRPTRGRQFGTPSVATEISVGARCLQFEREANHSEWGAAVDFNLEYGDRFKVKSTNPYDYFTLNVGINAMNGQPLLSHLEIKGRLLGRELMEEKNYRLNVGLYQHFDFFDSDTIRNGVARCPYKLGVPASLGGGVMFRANENPYCHFDAYTHLNGVILGSVLSDYYMVDDRNYNLASGFGVKAGLNVVLGKDRLSLTLDHHFYRLFTWKGYHRNTDLSEVDYRTLDVLGDQSVATFSVTEFRTDAKIWQQLYGTFKLSYYYRSTHYRDYSHISSSSFGLKFMLTYKF